MTNLAMNANIFPAIVNAYVMIVKSTFVKCHNIIQGSVYPYELCTLNFQLKNVLYLHILRGSTVLQETKCTWFHLTLSQETLKLS